MIYKRDVIDEILNYINERNIIVLLGARQVGKTSILLYLKDFLVKRGETVYYIDLEDRRYVDIIDEGHTEFIKHLKEEGYNIQKKLWVFIDEIQYLSNPSNFLKLIYDHYKNINLLVSGSSTFEIRKKFKDSLVGRTLIFEVFPLSFFEFLRFKGEKIPTGTKITEKRKNELKKLFIEYVRYGGYPRIVLTEEGRKKEKYLSQIINSYILKDIRDIGNIRDIGKFNKLLEVLAGQSGNLLNIEELSNTARISKQTVESYLFLMENTFILKLVRPYYGNLRSELFKRPKVYFYDSGIMQLLWLKIVPPTIIGNVFETAVFSELVKIFKKEDIFFWRTKDKKEIDFIIKHKNKIIPIEVKYNFSNFSKTSINYFLRKYSLKEYRVIGLEGDKKDNFIYPWEIRDTFSPKIPTSEV